MHSKKVRWNVLLMAAAICICYALLASCGHGSSGPTAAQTGGAGALASEGSCGSVAACAQKAVEAAEAARQTAENTNKALATLTYQQNQLSQQLATLKSQVNERIDGLQLSRTAPMTLGLGCQGEFRPDEKFPDRTVVLVGKRDCSGAVGGAAYYEFLDISKPPIK
jgi:hypothetical protein